MKLISDKTWKELVRLKSMETYVSKGWIEVNNKLESSDRLRASNASLSEQWSTTIKKLNKANKDIASKNEAITNLRLRIKKLNEFISFVPKKKLSCDIDEDSLCIMNEDFINLAENDAYFIKLTKADIKAIEALRK